MPCPHTGEAICDALYKCLQSWNIDCRVSTVTLDNCSSNDTMIGLMESKIGPGNLLLDGDVLHMRCCVHILNLIVKDGLEIIGPSVVKIRDSVAYWIATPKRYEKFMKTAQLQKVQLNRKLCLDCKTRWNSTYTMLSIAIPYKKVFERLHNLEPNYQVPPEDDWKFASIVCEKLKLFYELTELFSGTKYVSANIFFPKVCEIKLKMKEWREDENVTIREMSKAMIAKYDKYWTDVQGLMAIAVILDPRLKMTMLHACYIALLGEEEAEIYVSKSYEVLTNLINQYLLQSDQECVGTSSSGASFTTTISATAVLSIFKSLAASKKTTTIVKSKNELDRYLEEETLPHDENEYFDILGWWKVAGTRYPTLRLIARDVLAIPITTVASESAFSTSGRVLSEHRSRLTPQMLEALMCTQSWFRHALKGKEMCLANILSESIFYILICILFYNIGEDNVDVNSFWSCLEDIEEEMKEDPCIASDD